MSISWRKEKIRATWPWIFVLHEIVVLTCALVAFPHPSPAWVMKTQNFSARAVLWLQYDALFYIHIAHHGYGRRISPFYPLLPVVIWALGNRWIALLVMQGVFALDLWLLSKWLSFMNLSHHTRTIALFLFSFNPAAVFYSTLYTESLTVLFWLLSILSATRKRYGLAAVAAGLAALSHPTGAILGVVPLGLLVTSIWKRNDDLATHAFIWGSGVAIGLLAYMAFAWFQWHNPWAPWLGEQLWRSRWGWPWQQYALPPKMLRGPESALPLLSIPFLIGALSLIRFSFPMKGPLSLFTWANLIVSLSFFAQQPFHSTLRLMSTDVPVYAGIALIKNRYLLNVMIASWMLASMIGALLFTHQWWWQ